MAVDVSPKKSLRDGEVRDVKHELERRPLRRWTTLASALFVVASGVTVADRMAKASRAARIRQRGLLSGVALGSALIGAALARWQLARLFTEEPAYTVEERDGAFEVRRYEPLVLAKTPVDGPLQPALDEGFRRLASYIFGKANLARNPSTRLPSARRGPRDIPMTAPVVAAREGDHHVVAFVMPQDETLASLPAPTDERVELEPVAAQRVAALRFSGRHDAATIRQKQEELFRRVTAAGLIPTGEPEFAGYDPPWTLPALRRLEVWIPIA